MTDREHIPQEDLALFAMGSLTGAEAATVSAHLSECEQCRASYQEIMDVLVALGASVEQLPLPSDARQRFVQRIAAEPASSGTGSRVVPFIPPESAPPRRSPLTLLPWLLAAAMLACAVYLGSEVSHLRSSRDEARSQAAQLAVEAARAREVLDVLTAPTAQQVTLTEGKPAPAPTGHTSYMPSKGELVFVASNMHELPATKVYELWVIPANGHAPMPAGTFRPDERGAASVVLPPLPVGIPAKAFGVTIEQAQGSATPTMPIILSGS